jgi:hypothetical protein
MFAAVLLATGAVLHDTDAARLLAASVWFAVLFAGLVLGLILSWRLNKSRNSLDRAHSLGWWLAVNAGFCGLVWGSADWLLLPGADSKEGAFVLVGIAMVLVGGAAAQAAHRAMVLLNQLLDGREIVGRRVTAVLNKSD